MAHTAPSLPFVAGVLQRENFHAPKRRRASVNTPTTTPTVITHREKHHSCAPGARQHLWKGGRFLRGREKPEGGFQTCFCPFLCPFFFFQIPSFVHKDRRRESRRVTPAGGQQAGDAHPAPPLGDGRGDPAGFGADAGNPKLPPRCCQAVMQQNAAARGCLQRWVERGVRQRCSAQPAWFCARSEHGAPQ